MKCKYVVAFLDFLNAPMVESYLSDMAASGFALEKVSWFWYRFRKEEESDKHFRVVFSEKKIGSAQIEICKKSGWDFVGRYARHYVFCTDKSNPTDFSPSYDEKMRVINRKIRNGNSFFWPLVVSTIRSLSLFVIRAMQNEDSGERASGIIRSMIAFVWMLYFCVYHGCGVLKSFRRRAQILQGTEPTVDVNWQKRMIWFYLCIIIFTVLLMGSILWNYLERSPQSNPMIF